MKKIKVRITSLKRIERRFSIIFMGTKVAVAFNRDSGAKVGYDARLISGEIGSGGSRVNWHCWVDPNTIFELEVDKEFFEKNKNRIKNWEIKVLKKFTISKKRNEEILKMENNLE